MMKMPAVWSLAVTLAGAFFLPVSALPGHSVDTEARWFRNHPFFPAKSFESRLDEFAAAWVSRPLSDDRVIDFKGYYYDGGDQILYESIAVFRTGTSGGERCSEIIDIGSGEQGYFSESATSTGMDFNTVWPECTEKTGVDFLDRGSPTTQKTVGLVYGSTSPILQDLQNAKMAYKGHQYFFLGFGSRLGETLK
ncbi:MAG: hypothetical protein ACAI44_40790, partial [Candidatus Sericytochromatia bacterium]